MNLPGFTAEASLSHAIGEYYSPALTNLFGGGVFASADEVETFNCGPCSEVGTIPGLPKTCMKWCCDAVSHQNCQWKTCTCPTKKKTPGSIF